jgi:TonB family protein
MTAAAAVKPHLFNHLFATQPERPEKSLSATVVSVLLHAGLIGGAVWASVSFKDAVKPTPTEVFTPVMIANPSQAPAPARGGGGNPGAAPSTPRYELPADPNNDLEALNKVVPPLDFRFGDDPIAGPPSSTVPGKGGNGSVGEGPGGFEVLKELPNLLNRTEVQRALERSYPALLRDAGIGGTAVMWMLLDENGRVVDTQIKESSGQAALDKAALEVAPLMRFSPAKNRDQRVKVWVVVPLKFVTH